MILIKSLIKTQTVSKCIIYQLVFCTVIKTSVGKYNDGLCIWIIGIAIEVFIISFYFGSVISTVCICLVGVFGDLVLFCL